MKSYVVKVRETHVSTYFVDASSKAVALNKVTRHLEGRKAPGVEDCGSEFEETESSEFWTAEKRD